MDGALGKVRVRCTSKLLTLVAMWKVSQKGVHECRETGKDPENRGSGGWRASWAELAFVLRVTALS